MIKSSKSHFSKVTDGFSQILKETAESFAQEGISILGEGIREVLTENVYFEQYVDRLCEGLDADDQEVVSALMENTRDHILNNLGL